MEEINIPAKKLWNPKSFIIFSILFSFFSAGIMYSLNYGRIGDKRKKWTSLISVILCFMVIFALVIIVPSSSSVIKSVFFVINIAVGMYFYKTQTTLYEEHIKNGGEKASYILPVIICIIVSALLIAAAIYSGNIPDKSLEFNKSRLYYTDNVTEAEARKLGDYLNTQGFFGNDAEADVKLDKQDETYIFSLIVNEDNLNDSDVNSSMKSACSELSENVFNNKKVRIDFCNSRFQVQRSFLSE